MSWGIRPKEVSVVVLHFPMLINSTKFKLARNSLNKLNMTRNVKLRTKGCFRRLLKIWRNTMERKPFSLLKDFKLSGGKAFTNT